MEEPKYRIVARCNNKVLSQIKCGAFLMATQEKPHFTRKEIKDNWLTIVTSAPLNAPPCPECHYSTERDMNAGLDFFIDDGVEEVEALKFFGVDKK